LSSSSQRPHAFDACYFFASRASRTSRTPEILLDEFDSGEIRGRLQRRQRRLGSFRKKPKLALIPCALAAFEGAHAWSTTVLVDELGARGLEAKPLIRQYEFWFVLQK
jgi:hypothetical protein